MLTLIRGFSEQPVGFGYNTAIEKSRVWMPPVSNKDFNNLTNDVRGLTTTVNNLSLTIAALRGSLRVIQWITGITAPILIGVAITAIIWCNKLSTKVAVIESGGDTKLITQLEKPKNQQQLQAALATVNAQVQTARADGKKPDSHRVQALSSLVSNVVVRQPELAEGWQAAAALVSYRGVSSPDVNTNKPCIGSGGPLSASITRDDSPAKDYEGLHFDDCTLTLDDSFTKSASEGLARIVGGRSVPSIIKFNRVRLIYRGGSLPKADLYLLIGCTFDFQFSTPPLPLGEQLTKTLLQARNLQDVSLFFSDGPLPS